MKYIFFKPCALVIMLVCLMTSIVPSFGDETPSVPHGMRLFLLIGQSNMAGRGIVETRDQVTNPRIWMLDKNLKWILAKDPLHFDKPTMAGVGLGSEFARTLAKEDSNITIGLIPSAVGGTTLDQWNSSGQLYKDAVARTKEAMKSGTLAGILWHQGEGDSSDEKVATYPTRFTEMISTLRQDLNAPDVPVIVGELSYARLNSPAFNAMLPELAKQVPLCAVVSAKDLQHKGDKVHFNTPSLRTFGWRYAAEWLKLKKPNAAVPAPPKNP